VLQSREITFREIKQFFFHVYLVLYTESQDLNVLSHVSTVTMIPCDKVQCFMYQSK
jgi:hypothetical protein